MPDDRELLREVYRLTDREEILRRHPGLSEERLKEFFRKIDRSLSAPSSADAARTAGMEPVSPTRADSIVLYTDGGSRGNPGPAAYGIVLNDPAGKQLLEKGVFIGQATNNEAEYGGLIAGIEAAIAAGAKDLLIRSDSELLVRQLGGQYKVKSRNLIPLFMKARKLLEQIPKWRAEHIPRERNRRADLLANEAMDRG